MGAVNLGRMKFDPTLALASAGSTVGGYVVSKSGEVIDHTDVGGTKGLNVNVLNDLNADMDGIYDGVSNIDPDNVGMIAHARGASPADADQTFRSTGATASSDAVVAANVHGLDVNSFGMLYNGSTWDRAKGDNGSLLVKPIFPGTEVKASAVTAIDATTPLSIAGTALTDRVKVILFNNGQHEIELSHDSGFTIGSGLPLPKDGSIEMDLDDAEVLYALSNGASNNDLRVMEIAATA